MKFIVVLHTDNGQRYGVTVPDLPGCFSAGNGLDDALESVREAIDLHVETLIEDGADIPNLGTLTQHQANRDYAGGVWAVVDVPVEKYLGPADKINITVPRMVLNRIDEYAKKHGQSRSGFMVAAARAAMHTY
ncbi:MAG: type II toxin-antitoxin system HicB family antitoxin [Burkholderiaceae bacterium]|nr:type II toxin-antitoxin system HicB family antitoxin [Burkholderiaceae bacterium]